MLGREAGEEGEEDGANKTLKNFRGGAKEGDGAIGNARGRGFVRFKDRDDEGRFPDRREIGVGKREVKKRGKKGDAEGTEVLQMQISHSVGTHGRRIFD